jgi:RNA-binding protein 39
MASEADEFGRRLDIHKRQKHVRRSSSSRNRGRSPSSSPRRSSLTHYARGSRRPSFERYRSPDGWRRRSQTARHRRTSPYSDTRSRSRSFESSDTRDDWRRKDPRSEARKETFDDKWPQDLIETKSQFEQPPTKDQFTRESIKDQPSPDHGKAQRIEESGRERTGDEFEVKEVPPSRFDPRFDYFDDSYRPMGPRERRSVYVQQLAVNLSPIELKDFMFQAGPVRKISIFKDSQGRSRGRGYVEFVDIRSAQRAIELTDKLLLGIPILVDYTEAEKSRLAHIQARNKLAEECGIIGNNRARIYVANVFPGLTEETLKKLFQTFGTIVAIAVPMYRDLPKGYAFIQ